MLDSSSGDFLKCYADALQIIPHDLQHLISSYLQSDLQHQRLLSNCSQIACSNLGDSNECLIDSGYARLFHSLLAIQDICDRRISIVNEMEDLLERHTHALFISRGRLNAVPTAQACTSTEANAPTVSDTATDGGLELRNTGSEHPIGPDKPFFEDMYPKLKASLLKQTVGNSVSVSGENTDPDNVGPPCKTSHFTPNFSSSNRMSSTSRKSLTRWSESRLYQRKVGLIGTHKVNLQSFKHRRQPSEQSLVDSIPSDARSLHKTYSAAYPRYPRVQHQRFKSQKHSLSRALYTNRSRSRQLSDQGAVGLHQYYRSRLPFPAAKSGGYYYVPDDNRSIRAINQDSSDEANEVSRRTVEKHWRCNTSLRQKDLISNECDPLIDSLIRTDDGDSDSYYMKKKAVISSNLGHSETTRTLDEGDTINENMSTTLADSTNCRRQSNRPNSHTLKRNSRCRHFGHEPAHRRLCQLKSRQSRKLVNPNQPQRHRSHRSPESTSERLPTCHSSLNAPSSPTDHHNRSQNRSDPRNRFNRINPTHSRLSRLRVRSESHHQPHHPPQSHHNPMSRSVSPPDVAVVSMASTITSTPLVPTSSVLSSNSKNRLRTLGERNDDEDSDSVASPDERLYCLCRKLSFGDMIACDNKRCEVEWFHFACVDVRVQPKGKWYCPFCRGENSKTKRTES